MKSEDDPEARIRELEQPLAEAARASEAGENPPPSKWAPPPGTAMPPPPGPPMPPPPSLPYGGLFPSPSPAQYSRSNRTVWIIAGVFVVGMIALPAAIFLFTAHQVSRSGLPTMFPTPIIPSNSPSPPGGMTQIPSTGPSSIPTPEPPAPAGDNLTISGINETQTVTCNSNAVNVSGISNKVVIKGLCKSLHVSGVQNVITIDAVGIIEVSGFSNQITYHGGSPRIDKSGDGNVVQQG
jgi:hypothetical protein